MIGGHICNKMRVELPVASGMLCFGPTERVVIVTHFTASF